MSLKQIINRSKMLNNVIGNALELPGEPMIYSVKCPVGQRTRSLQFFRNMKWKGILKTFFRSFNRTTTPVAISVRFMVSPPGYITVPHKILHSESLPAVMSYELCEYTLSFLEMLHTVLFNSYRQVVKLDIEKFYSSNPRTIVRFMTWEEYDKLQSSDTDNAETESLSKNVQRESLQSQRKRNGRDNKIHAEEVFRIAHATTKGTTASDSAFCDTSTTQHSTTKKRTAKLITPCEAAGRRQSGEVSQ